MTPRTEARLAGVAYLTYIVVAMSAAILSPRTTAGTATAQTLSTLARMIWLARITVLLDLIGILCAVLLAVTLYRLTKPVSATLALLAMCFRLGEGLLGFLPVLGKLELMRLATSPDPRYADPTAYLALATEILTRPDEVFSEFCFVVGGFLFAWLFLKGNLIPRWLAWTGVVTIGVQLICVPLQVATILSPSLVNLLWIPILLYEVPLGFWLILKGVPEQPATETAC